MLLCPQIVLFFFKGGERGREEKGQKEKQKRKKEKQIETSWAASTQKEWGKPGRDQIPVFFFFKCKLMESNRTAEKLSSSLSVGL